MPQSAYPTHLPRPLQMQAPGGTNPPGASDCLPRRRSTCRMTAGPPRPPAGKPGRRKAVPPSARSPPVSLSQVRSRSPPEQNRRQYQQHDDQHNLATLAHLRALPRFVRRTNGITTVAPVSRPCGFPTTPKPRAFRRWFWPAGPARDGCASLCTCVDWNALSMNIGAQCTTGSISIVFPRSMISTWRIASAGSAAS